MQTEKIFLIFCLLSAGQTGCDALLDAKRSFGSWNADSYYNNVHTGEGTRVKDCLKCGKCEELCPQHLEIRRLLKDVSAEFDK